MSGIEILGTGSYVPEFVADNDRFSEILDTSDEWIFPRTGIKRRQLSVNKPNYYMGTQAAERAVENAGISPEEIDLIIVSTCTPDFFYPVMSGIIQKKIGAKNASVFDINAACTGFITALDIAHKFLETGKYEKILIVASERLSTQQDYKDRANCILFGDAAGAVVVKKSDKMYGSFLGAEGDEADTIYCKVHYETNCPWTESDDGFYGNKFDTFEKKNYLYQDGRAVYKFAVNAMADAVTAAAKENDVDISSLDLVIPHQANLRIIEKATELLGVPKEKVYTNIEYMGNVSSACIPVGLDELNRAGRLRRGMKLCMVGFGAGLTYGSIIMEV